jgi:hypothetical protein
MVSFSVIRPACRARQSNPPTLVRAQMRLMQPKVLPYRIIFYPPWKYMDTARIFRAHTPTGFSHTMFTPMPSRSVFIDKDRYSGEEWLAHWMAHELGHLAANSASEEDAEKVAREYRKRLKGAREPGPTLSQHRSRTLVRTILVGPHRANKLRSV